MQRWGVDKPSLGHHAQSGVRGMSTLLAGMQEGGNTPVSPTGMRQQWAGKQSDGDWMSTAAIGCELVNGRAHTPSLTLPSLNFYLKRNQSFLRKKETAERETVALLRVLLEMRGHCG